MSEAIAQPGDNNTLTPGLFGFEGKPELTPEILAAMHERYLQQVPATFANRLLPFQRILYVEDQPVTPGTPKPSATKALLTIMGVARTSEIGESGPANAATSSKENADVEQLNLLGALFGRDSLHNGMGQYEQHPGLLENTVLRLAELQGVANNIKSDEKPGRIIHWAPEEGDPVAVHVTEQNGWDWPHYGAVDSTPMYIRAVLRLEADQPGFLETPYIGRDDREHSIGHSLEQAISWLEMELASNKDGLLEFRMEQERGIWNQAWKDTPESYVHADGSYANHAAGIASIETQQLAYDTLMELAAFFERSDPERAKQYHDQATRIQRVINETFYIEDERGAYLALATDRDEHGSLRPLRVRSSNMGHALRLLDDPRKQQSVIATLFSDELLDRNGIRTLSNREIRFIAESYHCGSVWPFDTKIIVDELRKLGYHGLAHDLDVRVLRSANESGHFLEFISGNNAETPSAMLVTQVIDLYDGAREHYSNCYRASKPPQEVQGWTVDAVRKIKEGYQPLARPGRRQSLPWEAHDPAKRSFEQRILATVSQSLPPES